MSNSTNWSNSSSKERVYQHTYQSGEQFLEMELSKEVARYKESGQTGLVPKIRELLEISRERISQNFLSQNWENTGKTYEYIYQASSQILSIPLTRSDKESLLRETQGLVSLAAYSLAKQNKLEDAVVRLEGGIARLLSEALQQANLEQLKTAGHTDLYNRYKELKGRKQWT